MYVYNAKRVRLLWVLEHSDIEGNELTVLANQAAMMDFTTLEPA